jgi:hypothetical protein
MDGRYIAAAMLLNAALWAMLLSASRLAGLL